MVIKRKRDKEKEGGLFGGKETDREDEKMEGRKVLNVSVER